jgi:hypothetical protein
MPVKIYFSRIGKGTTVYTEEQGEDNGTRLKTLSRLHSDNSRRFSRYLARAGHISGRQQVATVQKFLFYQEWFDIIVLHDLANQLIGYYCDICTPLVLNNGRYEVTDLFLDLWIASDGSQTELDWDEFEAASAAGLLTAELQAQARRGLEDLKHILHAGTFYQHYLL